MTKMESNETKNGDYTYLGRELRRRTIQPWQHFAFLGYFVGAIILLGGLGIWVEVLKFALPNSSGEAERLFAAMATFFPALAGAATFHMILTAAGGSDKVISTFAWIASLIALAAGGVIRLVYDAAPDWSIFAVIVFVGISLWLWTIANADDPLFKKQPVDSPSGGSTDRQLKGSTSGFEVD